MRLVVLVVMVVSHSASGNKPTGPFRWTTRNALQQTTNLGLAPPFVHLSLLEFDLSRSHSLRWSWRRRHVRIMLLLPPMVLWWWWTISLEWLLVSLMQCRHSTRKRIITDPPLQWTTKAVCFAAIPLLTVFPSVHLWHPSKVLEPIQHSWDTLRIGVRTCCHCRRRQTILPHCRLSRCDRNVFAFRLCCLSASRCHGNDEPYLRTIEQNAIFGRTQDHLLSINSIATKDAKRENNNDDDGVVHSLHAAVMEQRMSTYGLW